MLRKIYVAFGLTVIFVYAVTAWFGWEFINSGRKSALGVPFIYTGFRGGK